MTIASLQFEALGARTYLAEGPFGAAGQTPLPSFKPGEVLGGDCEAEFVYLLFAPTASVTLNQGDWLTWDQTYNAVPTPNGSGAIAFGANVGTLYLGGRSGDPAAWPNAGNVWSQTFTPGVYGIFVQRAGTSLMNVATINAQSKPMNTTAVAGQMNQPTTPLASSMGVVGAWTAPLTATFTATTVTGSAILTVVSSTKGYAIGQKITGTGIASSTVISDIQGSTVTLSKAATASGSGVTMTVTANGADVTTTNASAVLTNVSTITGLYPNATITGTGIPASTTIISIGGSPGAWTVTMSAAATATANNIAVANTIYYEGFLRWPYAGVQN